MRNAFHHFSRLCTVITAGAIGCVLTSEACSLRGPAQSRRAAPGVPSHTGDHQMITFHQALEAACSVVERSGPGDLVVELKGGTFRTTVFFVTAEDRRSDHAVEVAVDAESGKVLTKEARGLVRLLRSEEHTSELQSLRHLV